MRFLKWASGTSIAFTKAVSTILKILVLITIGLDLYAGTPACITFYGALARKQGTQVDSEILKTYQEILRNVIYDMPNNPQSMSSSKNNDPVGFFRNEYWDSKVASNYFLSPRVLFSIDQTRDLDYLKHILQTSLNLKGAALSTVLAQANHSWVLEKLPRFPRALKRYSEVTRELSFDSSLDYFQLKLKSQSTLNPKEVESILGLLKISRNSLDLTILNSFFDLLLQKNVSLSDAFGHQLQSTYQIPSISMLESLWAGPPLLGMARMLTGQSHDTLTKANLLEIFETMQEVSRQIPETDFKGLYKEAALTVQSELNQSLIPPPRNFQTDLIFVSKRNHTDGLQSVRHIDIGRTGWNDKLGQIESELLESIDLIQTPAKRVSDVRILVRAVEDYIKELKKEGKYSDEEIDLIQKMELATPLEKSTFFIFSIPELPDTISMIKLLDATHSPSYIETEFPHVTLPGRGTGVSIIEINRLLNLMSSRQKTTNESVFYLLSSRIAHYLKSNDISGYLYFDVDKRNMEFHLKKGAEIIFTPEQLENKKTKTSQWVMRYTTQQYVEAYLKYYNRTQRLD